jgi:glycine/D-amino acid oxidase-like deaminating enzyme
MSTRGPENGVPNKGVHQNHWVMAALVVGALVTGAAALGLMAGQSAAPETVQPRAQSPAPAGGQLAHAAASAASNGPFRSKWTGSKQPRWARDGSKTIAFELEAEKDIAVWMKRVRPYLAVRCLYHNTEVMVMPDSAASIEPNDRHTVRVSFDDGPEVQQLWFGSDDHQALFTPDGAGLANQIATARTMRFGFTPYNAKPVVIEFDVRGFDDLIGVVAKTCASKPVRNPRGK